MQCRLSRTSSSAPPNKNSICSFIAKSNANTVCPASPSSPCPFWLAWMARAKCQRALTTTRHHRAAAGNVRQNHVHSRRVDVELLRIGDRSYRERNRRIKERSTQRQTPSHGRKNETRRGNCLDLPRRRSRPQSRRKFPASFP